MLHPFYRAGSIEAGCDEAGRGCLAGPVFAAAVIMPPDFCHMHLNDSKQMTGRRREALRVVIEREAVAWHVAQVAPERIDRINILNASFEAMNIAAAALTPQPEMLLIDGNRFSPATAIPHVCIVGGDGKYVSIAAASVLAKTHRDEYMDSLDAQFPHYGWRKNKGYPTARHRIAIRMHGITPHHRVSFGGVCDPVLDL